eukprot:scaffold11767_cov83-Skeletonema_dohrnii-CCMP3373.AAC.1
MMGDGRRCCRGGGRQEERDMSSLLPRKRGNGRGEISGGKEDRDKNIIHVTLHVGAMFEKI